MEGQTKAILVPVDFTEAAQHAIVNAIHMGARLNSDVHLVNFIPPPRKNRHHKASAIDEISEQLVSSMNLLKENESKLAEMLRGIEGGNVFIHSEIKIDKLVPGIKKQLREKNLGLIVIGISGGQTIGDLFFRTIKVHDLMQVNCPIMICNNHQERSKAKQTMVVSLEFNSLEEPNILSIAAIARDLDTEICYLHVNHPSDSKKVTKGDIEAYLKEQQLSADAVLVVESDNKEQAIKKYASEKRADFIAISRLSKYTNEFSQAKEQTTEQPESPVFVY